MKVGMYDSRLDGPILPKSVRKSLDTQRTESGPDIPGMMLRPSTGHRSLRSIARRWKVQVTVDELKSRIAASGLACASQGTSPTPRPCPAIGARQSCSRCDSQKLFAAPTTRRDETTLPTRNMAADEIHNAAADSPSAGPAATTSSDAPNKNNGHRGKRGGRDRGNDKQKKRKHTGFGSAKYVVASAIACWISNADTNQLLEATSPTSASRSRTTAMRSAAGSSTRTTTGIAT
jgi:hypothetical protein